MFTLNDQLKADSFYIASLKLSDIVLMNNSDYPWIILVPRRDNIVEITDLTEEDYQTLYQEIKIMSIMLKKLYPDSKLNIATIGNIVSQLHVHIVVRTRDDKLWPKVVWGLQKIEYSKDGVEKIINIFKEQLDNVQIR